MFIIKKKSKKSQARLGLLKTPSGNIETPVFIPIATQGAIKNLTTFELEKINASLILGNTYHLFFKPGLKVIKKAKGIHNFINWPKPILTDSGGFQVFSLAYKNQKKNYQSLVKIIPRGVYFKSVYDGAKHFFTPKKVLAIQKIIGSDIRMVLDICSPAKCSKEQAKHDLAITIEWAKLAKKYQTKDKSLLFGIVQGALYKDLRLKSVSALVKLNFDGYAIGGLAVGESEKEMGKVLDYTAPALPEDKPRYLMGVGYPEQIIEAVRRGIDMFDCVIPTREARHGRMYYFNNSNVKCLMSNFYKTIHLTSQKYKKDFNPINPNSVFAELRQYSNAYLRHLFNVGEPLAMRLATLNNLEFYLRLMERIKKEIINNKL